MIPTLDNRSPAPLIRARTVKLVMVMVPTVLVMLLMAGKQARTAMIIRPRRAQARRGARPVTV